MVVGGIILCRLDSSRLPGKVLKFAHGRPLLDYLLARARRIPPLQPLVVATSDRPVDDPIAEYCRQQCVAVFRGAVDDVAGRTLACARLYGMTRFCRLNGDSPFIEPALVSRAIDLAEAEDYDLVTTLQPRSFPYGVSVEVIETDAFERAYQRMHQPDHFEHVTRYLYENLDQFRFTNIACPSGNLSGCRMTIDTEEDFVRFERILDHLGDTWEEISYRDVLACLNSPGADVFTDGKKTQLDRAG